jgi:xanthine/CO dehydrogenase XdhC/CoxF family maturation factor
MSASNLPIFRDALAWRQAGRAVAMACVVETWGSAPRPPGSRLVVDAEGNFSGSVSGGCVEAEVIGAAVEVMQADAPRLLEFGVADETAWRAGLSCGGRLKIYVENVGATQARRLEMLADECAARRACVLVTDIDSGEQRLVRPDEAGNDPLQDLIEARLRRGRSALIPCSRPAVVFRCPSSGRTAFRVRRDGYRANACRGRKPCRLRGDRHRSAHRFRDPGSDFPKRQLPPNGQKSRCRDWDLIAIRRLPCSRMSLGSTTQRSARSCARNAFISARSAPK